MKVSHLNDLVLRGLDDAVHLMHGSPVDLDRVLTYARGDAPARTVRDALGDLVDGLLDAPADADPVSASPEDAPAIMEAATSHDE